MLLLQQKQKKCQSLRQLYQIQAQSITCGLFFLQHDPFPANQVLKLLADLVVPLHYIHLIFRQILSSDAFCVNTLIKAYCSNYSYFSSDRDRDRYRNYAHQDHEPLLFYFHMLSKFKGVFPNSFAFPPLLSSCSSNLYLGQICHAQTQTIKHGVQSVLPVQNSLIHMYSNFGEIHFASHLFLSISPEQRDLVSWNSIIHAYAKMGDLTVAHQFFDQMPLKNVVSWNTIMFGYLRVGNPGWVLKLFREMMAMLMGGFRGTSSTTIVNVLTARARSARFKEGRSVHVSLLKNSFHYYNSSSSLILDTALIDMYSKCGKVEVARIVFDRMLVERNLVCWNAMVLGYCIHGCPEDGISLFTTMLDSVDSSNKQLELVPDEVTFVGILCACARAGLFSEGRNYFSQMSSLYNIKPKFAHFWCMANLYYGCGLVQEAEQILRSIPPEDTCGGYSSKSLVLSSLLGSCRFQGDHSDFGERIALRLVELEPHKVTRYNLLLNVYAVAGRWEEVGKVKEMMKEKGVRGMTGCSLVNLNKVVHEFEVGDKSVPQVEEVYTVMDELARELRLPPVRKLQTMGNRGANGRFFPSDICSRGRMNLSCFDP